MSSKQELEAEVAYWKREANANQILLNRQRSEEAQLKAAAKPPAKPKAQPKAKKAAKSR